MVAFDLFVLFFACTNDPPPPPPPPLPAVYNQSEQVYNLPEKQKWNWYKYSTLKVNTVYKGRQTWWGKLSVSDSLLYLAKRAEIFIQTADGFLMFSLLEAWLEPVMKKWYWVRKRASKFN